jgi:regulator of protease activity HflC (stomatin/prohibitin superfamily)
MAMEDTGGQTSGQPQPKTKWRRMIAALLIGSLPIALCFFVFDWWWPGTVFLLVTLFIACSAFDSRLYPFVFTLYAVFAFSWVYGSLADAFMAVGRGPRPWWEVVFPVIAGMMPALLQAALFWFLALLFSTTWVLGISETLEGISWWQAFRFVAARTFGFTQPFLLVENGKLAEEKPKGILAKFGGPGLLVVRSGNAVVLERGSKITRVVGPGVYELKKREYFKQPTETKGIFDLRGSGDGDWAKDVLTKDGIPIDFKCSTSFQIEPKSATDERSDSHFEGGAATTPVLGAPEYPVYEATILKAVHNTPDGGWKSMFPGGPINVLRDIVAAYTFDQIFPANPTREADPNPDNRVIKEIEDKVNAAVNTSSAGVLFKRIDIREIEMPDDIRAQIRKRWAAPIEGDVKIREAEAERDAMIRRSEGVARSIEQEETIRLAASTNMLKVVEELAKILPDMENERVAYGFVSIVRDLLGRIAGDERAAIRVLRELRVFMQSPIDEVPALRPSSPLTIPAEVMPVGATQETDPKGEDQGAAGSS